ncbi:Pentatricopeptide repeat-containing protein [Hibiscus syriacus]|uniref:Pentatricopeptide repeat-containing protein n=1 Tax=Hibiscus syriacus TaxID=106335 RepID=A0A6A3D016_HIBSY|nr:pentatricopeptide repeat-containing protein At3g09040, mitochondrial-like [Hibiscus syriacus]KAE8735033.1 Pentatricopeptide repeat-containing protein [Hibiscus syriacus]
MRLKFLSRTLPTSVASSFLHCSYFSTVLPHSSYSDGSSQRERFNHLVRLCLQQCREAKTHYLFDEMSQTRDRALKAGKMIHAHGLHLGFCSKGLLGNAILDFYAKCGDVDSAEKAFHSLQKRDVFAWNSVISMYSKRGLVEEVVDCIGPLLNSGVLPNEFTFATFLSACAKLKDVDFGRLAHCFVVKIGLEASSFCEGALIDMYSKCNYVTDARKVFDGSMDLDTISWTSMVAGYIQVGLLEEALKVFESMLKVGHVPDQVAFVTIINAFVGLGRLDDARALFSQMPNPNVVAWNVMISGHAKRGYEVEAIEFFQNMRASGVKSTRSTLGSVLSVIACLASLDFGLLVHGEAIKQGLNSNVYVGSSLISMYAKCEKIDAAKKVFDELHEKNVVLWNAMLGGYVQNGYADEVVELFSQMKGSDSHPDEFTYTSILSACASLGCLETGLQFHVFIIKNKFASNLFVANALVDMYAKSGALEEARKQFDIIKDRDNVSWNAIIVGYMQDENEVEAFRMFRRMILHGIVPDEVSLSGILSACANVQSLEQGKQVHCLAVKSGLDKSLYAGSALIDMYAKSGAIGDADKILYDMPRRGVVSMNSMIAGYAPKDLDRAVILLKEMQDDGLKPSEVTYTSLLDVCNEPHKLNIGRQIHCLIVKRGLLYDEEFLGVSLLCMYLNSHRDTDAGILFEEFKNRESAVVWTALISGHSQNDCNEEALHFFRDMHSCNVLPDQATFVSVLRACAVLSSLQEGRQIHALVYNTGYVSDELTSSALVDMYAKCGEVKCSVQVFNEMNSKNGISCWNSMIVGFAKNGYAEDALRIFFEMKQTHVMPDDVTFLGVLTACSHAGKVSEGRQIFDTMVNYGIKPRVDHCACVVDLLGRWGFLKEAEDFIDSQNFEPDAMIWAALLGACRIHVDEIRGQRAAEKLIELEPDNSSPYVLLSNIYAATGNWDEVNALRRRMREKRVQKFPGCSWIVVGQKTNLFIAGDKSHPKADEIEQILKDLVRSMREDGYDPEVDSLLLEEECDKSIKLQ